MFTRAKTEGVTSTAGKEVKKGSKGRVEGFAELVDGEYVFRNIEFGNYGRQRWQNNVPTTVEELRAAGQALIDLADGKITSTRVANDSGETAEAVEAE